MTYNRTFVERQQEIRGEILLRIYTESHQKSPALDGDCVYRRDLSGKKIGCSQEDAAFALNYLIKCGHVSVKGLELTITHTGIVAIEAQLMEIQGD